MAAYNIVFLDIVCLNGSSEYIYVTMDLYQHIVHMPLVRACDQ